MTIEKLHTLFLKAKGVCIDSRLVKDGMIFFALKAVRNGHDYADKALAKGASYAVIDDPAYQKDKRYILVDDVLTCLQDLARYHRKQIKGLKCIAITGSNGKTTTKELIHRILATQYRTQATAGNFNNHIGVPLTLLSLKKDTQYAIIEMGINHPGEINQLFSIALPEYGLITGIGKAHLEGFGDIKGVMKAKGELLDLVEQIGGLSFLNMNDKHIAHYGYYIQTVKTYGKGRFFSTNVQPISADPFLKVNWENKKEGKPITIQSQLIGSYNLDNITAAVAVGSHFKISSDKIKSAIEAYVPSNNRSEIIRKGEQVFLLDAYNANPSSMSAALSNFEQINADQKIIILGDMMELGKHTDKEHKNILAQAKEIKGSKLLLIGEHFKKAKGRSHTLCFNSTTEIKQWLQENAAPKAFILIKGSRSMRLEEIVK